MSVAGGALLMVLIVATVAFFTVGYFVNGIRGVVQGSRGAEEVAATEVERELERIRAAGEPITPDEMETHYRLPAGQMNAGPTWIAAATQLSTDSFRRQSAGLPSIDGNPPPLPGENWPELPRAQSLLAEYRQSLAELHDAASVEGRARYPTSFKDGLMMMMPEIQSLRTASSVLKLEAYVRAHEGDAAGAAESLHAMLMLARSCEGYPVQVGHLVHLALVGNAMHAIADLLPNVAFSDVHLQRLMNDLAAFDFDSSHYQSLLGERVATLHTLSNEDLLRQVLAEPVVTEEPLATSETASSMLLIGKLVHNRDRRFLLSESRKAIEAAAQPWPEKLRAFKSLNEDLQQQIRLFQQKKAQAMKSKDWGAAGELAAMDIPIFSWYLLPPFTPAVHATARLTAQRGITMAAIAAELHRRENGSAPPDLNALVPAYLTTVPLDPFSGKPLQFVPETDRIRIYSVFENQYDDHGRGSFEGILEVDKDLVLELPWPPGETYVRSPASHEGVAEAARTEDSEPASTFSDGLPSATANARSAAGGSSDPVRAAGQPIDLLELVSQAGSSELFRGRWTFRNGAVYSPRAERAAYVVIPVDVPSDYRLIVEVTPLAGQQSFNLGLIVDDYPVLLVIDGWDVYRSGLSMVDGKTGDRNSTTVSRRQLSTGSLHRIEITVQDQDVDVVVDGGRIISWRGDPRRFGIDRRFWPDLGERIYLASWLTEYRVTELQLIPL